MEAVAETIRLIGNRRCTVLISGETGTGKCFSSIHGRKLL
jgi:transcriptional regulator with GAF, ATPase, and Fis domain